MVNKHIISLIENFLAGGIEKERFCQDFIKFWIEEVNRVNNYKLLINNQDDETEKKSTSWSQIYDGDFQEMIDKVHSACYSYSPKPDEVWQIDAEQMKQEILQALKDYRSS